MEDNPKTELILMDFIRSHPFFSLIKNSDKARLFPSMEIANISSNTLVFSQGQQAEWVYFIIKGKVNLIDDHQKIVKHNKEIFGGESIFTNNTYQYNAQTEDLTTFVKIPADLIKNLIKGYPHLGSYLFLPSHQRYFSAINSNEETLASSPSILRVLLGWIFSLLVPVVVYQLMGSSLKDPIRIFLSIVSGGLTLLSFNIVYDFVPVLIILITVLVLGIVPSQIILEGFSSDSYLLILSLSGIASVIISSGIVYRFLIFMVRYLPARQSWYSAGLYILGSIITPLIPSATMKSGLAANMARNLIEILKLKDKSSLGTKITISNFYGVTSLNSVFFTGSLINFIAIGILPLQAQYQVASIGWLTTALVSFIVLIVTNLFSLSLWFHDRSRPSISKEVVAQQLEILGPLRTEEWQAIICIFFFMSVILTFSFYQVQFAWLSLFLFFTLSSLKIIKINEWAAKTDWSFLLFVSASIGIVKSFYYLGLDQLIRDNCSQYFNIFGVSKAQILASFVIFSILVRFIFAVGPSFIITMVICLPVAEFYRINPWIVTFVLLIANEIWLFPYQSIFYQTFESLLKENLPYEKQKLLAYNLLVNIAHILALYLSIPYWRQLGLL